MFDWDDIRLCVSCEVQHDISELYEGDGYYICLPCKIKEVKIEGMLSLAKEIFLNEEAFNRWMDRPNELFEGNKPKDWIKQEKGLDDVVTYLKRLQHGVFS